ncbi:hypothetical protein BpHYR1_002189 [Brachionus plicatilis]|uniref:Uncharacterized protein n=1 Tax=Brachionus plicatilis TaxID=10195 RepID=A0A3M7Q9P6_BRAPC|nr:hypothetical protein BpHYR1_002189 [Brachionus plicatilis]
MRFVFNCERFSDGNIQKNRLYSYVNRLLDFIQESQTIKIKITDKINKSDKKINLIDLLTKH